MLQETNFDMFGIKHRDPLSISDIAISLTKYIDTSFARSKVKLAAPAPRKKQPERRHLLGEIASRFQLVPS